jgi:hypothetical protein
VDAYWNCQLPANLFFIALWAFLCHGHGRARIDVLAIMKTAIEGHRLANLVFFGCGYERKWTGLLGFLEVRLRKGLK